MQISGTLSAHPDIIAATVIQERDVERLVDVTDPMAKKFQCEQFIRVLFGS
jgi:hypothetical protein